MATVRRMYRLTGYPTDSHDLAGARVRDFWKSKGYNVDVKNLGGDEPNIVATSTDGFQLVFTVGTPPYMIIDVTSPCARPDGAPSPSGSG